MKRKLLFISFLLFVYANLNLCFAQLNPISGSTPQQRAAQERAYSDPRNNPYNKNNAPRPNKPYRSSSNSGNKKSKNPIFEPLGNFYYSLVLAAKVIRVTDSSFLTVDIKGEEKKIRLINASALENNSPFYQNSIDKVDEIIKENGSVDLILINFIYDEDSKKVSDSGADFLAKAFVKKNNVGLKLVEEGLAKCSIFYSPLLFEKEIDECEKLQKNAKKQNLGIWAKTKK